MALAALLARLKTIGPLATPPTTLPKAQQKNYLAIDCEMVGVGPGGSASALARVSLVDFHGNILLDSYVKPSQPVTHYRTWVSGIRPHHLRNASAFRAVTKKVAKLIDNKILIGHAIRNDLQALAIHHPPELIRDTSTYQPLWLLAKTTHSPSLKHLASLLLDLRIQKQAHCSIDDAKATMAVYRTQQDKWEDGLLKAKAQKDLLAPPQALPKQSSSCYNISLPAAIPEPGPLSSCRSGGKKTRPLPVSHLEACFPHRGCIGRRSSATPYGMKTTNLDTGEPGVAGRDRRKSLCPGEGMSGNQKICNWSRL